MTAFAPVAGFRLSQAYPNPARDVVRFMMEMESAREVVIMIYNLQGERVGTVKGVLPQGLGRLDWNCGGIATGVYFARIKSGDYEKKVKVAIAR